MNERFNLISKSFNDIEAKRVVKEMRTEFAKMRYVDQIEFGSHCDMDIRTLAESLKGQCSYDIHDAMTRFCNPTLLGKLEEIGRPVTHMEEWRAFCLAVINSSDEVIQNSLAPSIASSMIEFMDHRPMFCEDTFERVCFSNYDKWSEVIDYVNHVSEGDAEQAKIILGETLLDGIII